MKKDYIAPEFELIKLRLTADILGDSFSENPDSVIYNDPTEDSDLDPFG